MLDVAPKLGFTLLKPLVLEPLPATSSKVRARMSVEGLPLAVDSPFQTVPPVG